MNPQKRTEIFTRFQAANPHPTTELEYTTPFELLVAVILSAQATDRGVNIATRALFRDANTPERILALGLERLTDYLSSLNFYRTKAKNVYAMCQMLLEQHGGTVPDDAEALQKLPGVGRKTANVILNTIFRRPTIPVDTHVFRVANRTGIAPGKTVEEVEARLMRLVPEPFRVNAHHWLILHGRYVCKAPKPDCPNCIIVDLCEYKAKTVAMPPARKMRA